MPAYFDHNATTPLHPAARAAWLAAGDEAWHNASSPYRAGARVRLRLDRARQQLASFLDGEAGRIVFTSGSTEAANAVLAWLAATSPADVPLLVNPTEHPCVLAAAGKYFAGRIAWLEVDAAGVVRLPDLAAMPYAGIVVMAANNETGVLQPWSELRAAADAAGVPFVCDAGQWLGKLPGGGLGRGGFVFGSAHKFGGPKGTGFLHLPAATEGFRGQLGGEQEHGHRGGTEDWPSIAAMLAALDAAETQEMWREEERLGWRDGFERELARQLPGMTVVSASAERLWNTVLLTLPQAENHRWVARLDKLGFQVATGSACATGQGGPSHVLAAMRVAPEQARRAVRISSGWQTTQADWSALAEALVAVSREVADNPAVISIP